MKDIHLIFNIDYKDKYGQLNFFRESLVKHIKNNMLEIPTFEQFKTLIATLDECNCFIWVHPSLGSEIASEGYDSEILLKVIPELESMNIKYMMITRTNIRMPTKPIIHVNDMIEYMKEMQSYLVSDLRKILEIKDSQEAPVKKITKKSIVANGESKKTILIVAATPLETMSFFEVFKKKRRKASPIPIDKITLWNFGDIGNKKIMMIKQGEMGSSKPSGSALVIKDAIDILNPDFVIMVGIAFGLKEDKQEIGQILISRELENYESAKISKNTAIQRGHKIPAGTTLFDRFDNSAIEYKKVKSEVGLIISGDKMVDSQPFVKKLIKKYPDGIGGEMEGTGLQSTCEREKKEWILIKGISDWGYNKQHENKDRDQILAITNVCDFLIYTFKKFNF